MPTPDFSQSAVAPVLIGLPGGALTGVAPGAVLGAVVDPTAAAPSPIAGAETAPAIDTPRPIDYAPLIPDPDDETMHTAPLNFAGQLILDQVFGIYRAPALCWIKGIQLAAQVAPVGADIIIELVDAAGVSLLRTATLPAGQAWSDTDFATPLPVLADGIVRAKVTQIGSAKAGSFLTATLIVQLNTTA